MKTTSSIIAVFVATLLTTIPLHAAQVWDLYNFKVRAENVAQVVNAFNRLQESEVGKNRMASVHLQASIFGGTNGTTHSIVAIYPSRAEFERASQSLVGTPEWRAFQRAMSKHTEAVGNSAMQTITGWGTVSNEDVVWEAIRVNVTDPAGVVKAFDTMMGSNEAQAFPGEIWLSAVDYGNESQGGVATHVITVGYESMAEMEAWNDGFMQTKAWEKFQKSIQSKMTLINRELVRFVSVYDHQISLEDLDQ